MKDDGKRAGRQRPDAARRYPPVVTAQANLGTFRQLNRLIGNGPAGMPGAFGNGQGPLAATQVLMLSTTPDPPDGRPTVPGVTATLTKPVPAELLLDALARQPVPEGHLSAPAPAGTRAARNEDPAPRGGRVLVVDDNDVNRLVAGGLLASMGYQAVEAADGVEAVDAVRAVGPEAFAAVLMDVHMPRLDGYAATRALRDLEGDRPRLPILALTATAAPSERARCHTAGMDDVLTKPLGRAELRAALEHWAQVYARASAPE